MPSGEVYIDSKEFPILLCLYDNKMFKRRKCSPPTLLDILCTKETMVLIYSFLLSEKNRDCRYMHYFFAFRELCKTCKRLSNRLVPFLMPSISSWKQLDVWTGILPNMEHMSSCNTSFPLCLPNLRLAIFNNDDKLNPNSVYSWNCPLLEYLRLDGAVTESGIQAISFKFPNLKCFEFTLPRKLEEFTVSRFSNLECLDVKCNYNADDAIVKRLYISNLPKLERFKCCAAINLIEFRNIPSITSVDLAGNEMARNILFYDPAPSLTHLHLGKCKKNDGLMLLDPYCQIAWQNVKS